MKKKSSIALGPGAPSLILIFVVLSMSVLAMLSLMTARNDLQLSRRSADVAERVYELRERAEEKRAAVQALLAAGGEAAVDEALNSDPRLAGVTWDGDALTWSETDQTRTLSCALRLDGGTVWTAQRLSTNIAENTAEELEYAAKDALANEILRRQQALDEMLQRCAEGAADWQDYLKRVAEAMPNEPAAEGVRLEGDHLNWVETDGTYRYACSVVIHPLDAERRSDFASVPVLLEENVEGR